MPHDPVQIALEHHRAGRLTRAEADYRAILAQRPDCADASHWLGVLLFQAGQLAEAVTRLERAAALRPGDAAFAHNLGQAYLAARRDEEAIAAFERALRAGADAAELDFGLGVARLRRGRVGEAISSFRAAVAKNPRLAQAHYHLAVALRASRQMVEARRALDEAVEVDPGYTAAWQAIAVLDREAGDRAGAEAALRRAREAARSPQERPASVGALEARLTPDEASRKLHDVLADAVGLAAPASLGREQVAALFDRYADSFDAHLRDKLGYRVPEMIAHVVAAARPDGGLDVMDLGCGTGLCGPLLRPLARMLAGVDLSAGMLARARERGVYDRLETADLVDVLVAATPASFDLLVAADVLNYVGDLAPTFEAAVAALRPGGLLAFSIETAPAAEQRMRRDARTHRYVHADGYVRRIAAIYGLDVDRFDPVVVRMEANAPVEGRLVVLRRPR